MFRILHDLATDASSISQLVHTINMRPEKDDLLSLLEESCNAAKEILINGISKAFEHNYDRTSVERNELQTGTGDACLES